MIASVIAIALGWGAFRLASDLWAGRHDNTPVATASPAGPDALRVTGHGVTLTFPHGWINVPTTPDQFARFLHKNAARLPHLSAAAKAELRNMQNIRNLAMLVYHLNHRGVVTANTNVLVLPASAPLREVKAHIKSVVTQFGATKVRDSLTRLGKYAALLVSYAGPHLAGRPAEFGAQAYIQGPSSTPIITVTTTTRRSAIRLLRHIAGTVTFG